MLNLPKNSIFGTLKELDILEFYDVPLLFSCEDLLRNIYLAVLSEQNEDSDIWTYVKLTKTEYQSLLEGETTIYNAFRKSEFDLAYKVLYSFDSREFTIEHFDKNTIQDQMLPEPQLRLQVPQINLKNALLSSTKSFSDSEKRSTIDLKFDFELKNSYEAPIKHLSRLLDTFQAFIDAIGQAVLGIPTRVGQIESKITQCTQLNFVENFAGSFGVRLSTESSVPENSLFEQNFEFENVMSKAINLINSKNDLVSLSEQLGVLESRVSAKYKKFLDSISDSESNSEIYWTSVGNFESQYTNLTPSEAKSISILIQTVTSSKVENITLIGKLTGFLPTSKEFEFADSLTGKNFKGRVSDDALASAAYAQLRGDYAATIEVTFEIDETLNTEKIRYLLKKIESLKS